MHDGGGVLSQATIILNLKRLGNDLGLNLLDMVEIILQPEIAIPIKIPKVAAYFTTHISELPTIASKIIEHITNILKAIRLPVELGPLKVRLDQALKAFDPANPKEGIKILLGSVKDFIKEKIAATPPGKLFITVLKPMLHHKKEGEGAESEAAPVAANVKPVGAADTSAVANGTVEGKPAVANGTVEGKPAVANGAVEGKPAVANGAVEGKPAVANGAVEGKPAVANGAVANGAVEGKPAVANGAAVNETGGTKSQVDTGSGNQMGAESNDKIGEMIGQAKKLGLNDAFQIVYTIAALFGLVIFVVLVITCIINIVSFTIKEIKQKTKITRDTYLFNKDSTDVAILRYTSGDNPDKEPYMIFNQQRIIGILFTIISIVILLFAAHVAIYLGFKLWSVISEKPFNDIITVPYRMFGILVILYMVAFVGAWIYKSVFIEKVQKKLKASKLSVSKLKSVMYNNLTDDSDFLKALRSDNLTNIQKSLVDSYKLEGYTSMAKKIFTLSVYNYYRYQIPDTDPGYDEVLKMFTTQGYDSQSVNPSDYLFYGTPNYIPNVYPLLRDNLGFGTIDRNKEYAMQQEMSQMFRDLNRKMAELKKIGQGKWSLFAFMWIIFFSALLFLLIFGFIFSKEIFEVVKIVVEFIKNLRIKKE